MGRVRVSGLCAGLLLLAGTSWVSAGDSRLQGKFVKVDTGGKAPLIYCFGNVKGSGDVDSMRIAYDEKGLAQAAPTMGKKFGKGVEFAGNTLRLEGELAKLGSVQLGFSYVNSPREGIQVFPVVTRVMGAYSFQFSLPKVSPADSAENAAAVDLGQLNNKLKLEIVAISKGGQVNVGLHLWVVEKISSVDKETIGGKDAQATVVIKSDKGVVAGSASGGMSQFGFG